MQLLEWRLIDCERRLSDVGNSWCRNEIGYQQLNVTGYMEYVIWRFEYHMYINLNFLIDIK